MVDSAMGELHVTITETTTDTIADLSHFDEMNGSDRLPEEDDRSASGLSELDATTPAGLDHGTAVPRPVRHVLVTLVLPSITSPVIMPRRSSGHLLCVLARTQWR